MNPFGQEEISIVDAGKVHGMVYPYDEPEIERVLNDTIEGIKILLQAGRAIVLPGIGKLEVAIRPSRKVSANFEGADNAKKFETGPRPYLRFCVDENFRRKLRGDLELTLILRDIARRSK